MGIEIQPPAVPVGTVGGLAGSVPASITPSAPVSATAAANTPVVITIPAVAGQAVRLQSLSFGYSVAAGTSIVTVVSNGVTIWQGVAAALLGMNYVPLPTGGLEGAVGFSMVITLPAGAATAVGALNVSSFYGT